MPCQLVESHTYHDAGRWTITKHTNKREVTLPSVTSRAHGIMTRTTFNTAFTGTLSSLLAIALVLVSCAIDTTQAAALTTLVHSGSVSVAGDSWSK